MQHFLSQLGTRVSSTGTLLLLACACCPAQLYTISTFAGGAPLQTPAPAINQSISPQALTTDAAGNVYFASGNCVFRLDPSGVLTRIAGTSRGGYSGDGGLATNAQLNSPTGLAFDSLGNLLIADYGNYRIRRISTGGIITTIAGTGTTGAAGEGPAVSAQLHAPISVAVDAGGNVYIGDNNVVQVVGPVPGSTSYVRKVSTNGIISTVSTSIPISLAAGLAVDSAGDLFIADIGNSRVLEVVAGTGATVVYAGSGSTWPGDGGPATAAFLIRPYSLAVDKAGDLYIGDQGQIPQGGYLAAVRKVSPGGTITTVIGGGQDNPINVPAPAVPLENAPGVAVDGSGNLYVADSGRILEVSAAGLVSTVAGSSNDLFAGPAGDGGLAISAQLALTGIQGVGELNCVALDAAGNLYIGENSLGRVRKVTSGGIISTFAQVANPSALATDASGNLYVATNGSLLKISANGTTNSQWNYAVAGYSANAMAVDTAGNLFFADGIHYAVRKLSINGAVTTVAGTGQEGFSGDGGPAINAQLNAPTSLAIDAAGTLYIFDGPRVRQISPSGIITTIAGNGTYSDTGDGGLATAAALTGGAVALDSAGDLFLSDQVYNRVRKVSAPGIITTIAGTGFPGYSGDDGPAITAKMSGPFGIAVDGSGNLYVEDTFNNAIRLLHPTNQSMMIGAVLDAASEQAAPISPGKILAIYGAGLGPAQPAQFQVGQAGIVGTQLAATTVVFSGIAAPVLYSSATQLIVIAPYGVTGNNAQVVVIYQGQVSDAFGIPVMTSSPSLFTLNETGAGQAAAVNADGTINTAANPAHTGSYISLYATGEGQTSPAGVDGKLASAPLPGPILPVAVSVGGQPANVTYFGGAPGEVAGLMQVNVQIPNGIQPGGYVPVILSVGTSAVTSAVTIAVAGP